MQGPGSWSAWLTQFRGWLDRQPSNGPISRASEPGTSQCQETRSIEEREREFTVLDCFAKFLCWESLGQPCPPIAILLIEINVR